MSPSSGNAGIDREEAVPASAAPWPSSAAALEAPTSCSNRALEIRKSDPLDTKMNEPIKWNEKNTKWFYDICHEEIRSKNMEVGNLSENVCHIIWQKLSKKGINCNEKQIRSKWEASKRIHSFWYKKVVSAKNAVKDDKWWKKVLKTRISLLEYRELKNGAPKDLDSLDIIFGCNETEKDVQSSQSLQQDVASLQKKLEFVTRDRDCMRKQLIEVEVLHQNNVDGLTKKVSLLSDKLQELKGKMRVFICIRPGKGSEDHICYPQSLELKGRGIEVKEIGHVKQYVYDKVFGPDTKQKQIFDEMSELVESSFDGHKVCIFAYGPTGSGKTHTMIGGSCNESAGLIPRSLKQIFARIDSMQNWNYTVHLSAAEIYLKDLYDLLAPGRCKIQDFNLIEIMVFDTASSIALLEEVVRKRSVRETKINSESSRSHFIFKVRISGFNKETGQSVLGFLVFIDLAGSARVSKSGAEGESLKEAAAINNSLLMLTTTLCDIAKDDNPTFRNTKLTHFLKPYLMGGPKTLMLVNISPEASSISETTLALQFAERTKVWGNEKTGQLGGHYSTSFLSPSKIVSQHIPEGQRKNKQFSVTSKVEQIKRYQPICSSVRKGLGTISRQTNVKKRNRHEDMVEGGNKQQKIC